MKPLILNDAVVLGLLFLILVLVFQTEKSPRFRFFYQYVPALLLVYFLPSLLNISWFAGSPMAFRIISGEHSKLYEVASRYLLPASLVLLCISIDLKAIMQLGPKAVAMFFTGTVGVVIGGPIAFAIVRTIAPDLVSGDVWRGMTTIAGSWIGGSANQTAMKEVFQVNNQVFSVMIAVDVLVANIWMAFLLYGAGISDRLDKWLKADNSAIEAVKEKITAYQASISKMPTLTDLITVCGVAFVCVAISHAFADWITPLIKTHAPYLDKFSLTSAFFWIVVVATTLGLILSFVPFFRNLEGVGASKIGSLLLYVLVATIGMQMDVTAVFSHAGLFMVGIIWMSIHAGLLILVARLIRAPFFFLAVGSQANIGGAASAPVVAAAFHPTLAPIGVLLAVLGYAVGTYGGWLCGIILSFLAQ
ncbi:MAG TPA: hypothetical protein DCM08_12690 [Microscillaceae bacterium]|jgi:uncharacterized membrane protein|nr:hypothetical protein [Microscillaceae bacterium]